MATLALPNEEDIALVTGFVEITDPYPVLFRPGAM